MFCKIDLLAFVFLLCVLGIAGGPLTATAAEGQDSKPGAMEEDYLPKGEDLQTLTVQKEGRADSAFVIVTQAVAVKESGPTETVAKFGEVYAFSPAILMVHRDEPTRIAFWNLQPDDEHDFMLMDEHFNILMKVMLRPLTETSFTFTFHREGLYDFFCAMHRPAMNGQILVLPPRAK